MIEYKNEDFTQVTNQEFVVVDFFATWCGPCQLLLPVMEEISKEVDFPVYKVDIDQHHALAVKNAVRSVPTLIVFKNGKEVARRSGYMPKEKVLEWLNQVR